MATQTPPPAERALRRVAKSYQKQGYRVAASPDPGSLPAFLSDCHPDLIAERDDDRVVVEIKPTGSLRGANDLVEIAERVATQPGWRLELVTFRDRDPAAEIVSGEWLKQALSRTDDAVTCVYRLELLAFMLRGIALRAEIRVRDKMPVEIARELAFAGVIDETTLRRIETAFRWQADLVRGHRPSTSASDQAGELERLCHELLAQAQTPED